ncbi:MAG: hypothetical protein SWH78_04960 [Thermodesulfobacteriota bacterium]|nr:hypothetical protein [Thermodesulfobacteriota bacterium]
MLRFGSSPAEMGEMSEKDISLAKLQLLIIMSKGYLKGYPLGEFRKEAVIENAEHVAKYVKEHMAGLESKEEMDQDHVFHLRVELLAVMAKAFAEGYPMGEFRRQALEDNLNYICEAITFDSQAYDMKFMKVA